MITRVIQKDDNGCWAACVSMLTGIDYDDVPKMTVMVVKRSDALIYHAASLGEAVKVAGSHWMPVDNSVIAVAFPVLRKAYRENLGLSLGKVTRKPRVAAIRPACYGRHAVVDDPSQGILDPAPYAPPWGLLNVWYTVTPL